MTNALLLPGSHARWCHPGEGYGRHPSGLWLPATELPEEPPPRLIGVGLFSGAGGMDLGFTQAGIHVAAATDGWTEAACTYLVNLGGPDTLVHLIGELPEGRKKERAWHAEHTGETVTADEFLEVCGGGAKAGSGWISSACDHDVGECGDHIEDDASRESFHEAYHRGGRDYDALPCEHYYLGDIRALTGARVLADLELTGDDIAVVGGGPPCQGFSISGKQDPNDPRNELVFEFMRVVTEIHPRAFVMENVPGMINMVTKDGVPVLDALSLMAEEGGMGTFEAIRQSLAESSGAGAALRSAKRPKRGKQEDVDDEELQAEEAAQLALDWGA